MSAYWNIISAIATLASIIIACNFDMTNPFLFALVLLIFGSAMACFGYTARETKDKVDSYAETLTQKAAKKAVEEKMPEIQEAVNDAVADAIDNIDINELTQRIEDEEKLKLRMQGKQA